MASEATTGRSQFAFHSLTFAQVFCERKLMKRCFQHLRRRYVDPKTSQAMEVRRWSSGSPAKVQYSPAPAPAITGVKWEPYVATQLQDAMRAGRTVFGKSIKHPADFFAAIDKDRSGWVDQTELQKALARLDVHLSAGQLEQLFVVMDR
jgi:hypothetical protein